MGDEKASETVDGDGMKSNKLLSEKNSEKILWCQPQT